MKILSGNSTYLPIKPTKKARFFAPKKKVGKIWRKNSVPHFHPTHLWKLEEIPPSHVYPNTSFDDGQVIGCFAISNWTAISCWELLMRFFSCELVIFLEIFQTCSKMCLDPIVLRCLNSWTVFINYSMAAKMDFLKQAQQRKNTVASNKNSLSTVASDHFH